MRIVRILLIEATLVLIAGGLSPIWAQATDDGEEEDNYTPTAAAAPSTDVFVGRLALGESPAVKDVFNATDRDGYDNQPFFLPDGTAVLYTSARSAEQTDIYRVDLETKEITQVTETPTSEYSPTVLPGGESFATIREAQGVQQLWKYAFDGEDRGTRHFEVEPTISPLDMPEVHLDDGTLNLTPHQLAVFLRNDRPRLGLSASHGRQGSGDRDGE